MKEIPLTKGMVALVDDGDFERASQFSWHAMLIKGAFYASTTVREKGSRKSRHLFLHRFILGGDSKSIDHIDGNGLNNQRSNLRPCTIQQNSFNKRGQKHSSVFKGVSWDRKARKWRAAIETSIDSQRKIFWLGNFYDEYLAAIAYDLSAIRLFGSFARTNILANEVKGE